MSIQEQLEKVQSDLQKIEERRKELQQKEKELLTMSGAFRVVVFFPSTSQLLR